MPREEIGVSCAKSVPGEKKISSRREKAKWRIPNDQLRVYHKVSDRYPTTPSDIRRLRRISDIFISDNASDITRSEAFISQVCFFLLSFNYFHVFVSGFLLFLSAFESFQFLPCFGFWVCLFVVYYF